MTTAPTGVPAADGDVLVLRALGLGDLLTGVPALRGVRRAWPGRRLVLAAPAGVGGWLVGLGVVDEVLPTSGLEPIAWDPAERGEGHVAVDLHGRGPASHRLLQATRPARLVAFGCAEAGHEGPTWRRDEHEVDRWCRMVHESTGAVCGPEDLRIDAALAVRVPGPAHAGPGDAVGAAPERPGPASGARAVADPAAPAGPPLVDAPTDRGGDLRRRVLLHPGAASGSRRWPPDRWGALGARLAATGWEVGVTGAPAERGLAAEVVAHAGAGARDLSGTAGLTELAALVAGARLLVCGDTGVAHLATALGTPSVLLFGPTPPAWWGPRIDPERHLVLWHGGPGYVGDPHGATVDPALDAVTVEEVWDAVGGALAAPHPGGAA